MSFNIRYYPNEDVWYIKDCCVYGDRVLSVQIFESGVYYTLNNRTGPFRNEELFESKALAEKALVAGTPPKYKPGDIVWHISFEKHRLLCGDYTIYKPYKCVITEVRSSCCGPEYKVLSVAKDCFCNMAENRLFRTKEEAEQYLYKGCPWKCFEKDSAAPAIPAPCATEFKKLNERLDKLAGGREVIDECSD